MTATERLDEAVLYPPSTTLTLQDVTPGALVGDLLRQAHERGALAEISCSFDADTDSAGAPWSRRVSMALSPGYTYRDALDGLARIRACTFDVTSPDGELRLYDMGGTWHWPERTEETSR